MFHFFDIVYYSIVLLMLAMGFLVIANSWRSLNNRIFFIVLLAVVSWMISLRLAWVYVDIASWEIALFWVRFSYGFSILGTSLMTIFIYYFPKENIKLSNLTKRLYLLFTASLFLTASFTPLINQSLVILNGEYIKDGFGPIYGVYVFAILSNLIASVYFSIKKFRIAIGLNKKKMALVTFGYLTFFLLAILTNVILPIFNILLFQRHSQLFVLVFIIPTFFAIYKYRFFDFSYLTFNTFRTFIIYSFPLVIAVFLITLFNILFLNLDSTFSYLISILISLLIFNLINKKFPIILTGDLKRFKIAIDEIKKKTIHIENYKYLQKLLEDSFLIQLHFLAVKLFVVRSSNFMDLPVYKPDHFTNILKKYKKDLVVRDELEFRKMSEKNRKHLFFSMDKLGADVCLPLFSEDNLIGFLSLKRGNNHPFSKKEINEILSLKNDLSISLMNILLKLNLEEENNLMKSIIDKKTIELKKQIKETNELVQQQSDFIAVTAHEFRTPLSIAMFQVEDIVKSMQAGKITQSDLSTVQSSLLNLKDLTKKLFEVQQYDLKKVRIKKEKIEIVAFIQEIYNNFSGLMQEKEMQFKLVNQLKKETHFSIDAPQLRQVLHNLLTNAYKFTPKHGKITLSAEGNTQAILIKVIDNGKGVPKSMRKAIFNKFRTNNKGAGIGLGLYICQKIVELHSGKLWVEDTPKGGATFCIQL